jgi:hypothetical protein
MSDPLVALSSFKGDLFAIIYNNLVAILQQFVFANLLQGFFSNLIDIP